MRRLAASLRATFRQAGPNSGGSVYDLTDDTPLFSLRAGVKRPPASVEKLYTTIAVLRKLGLDARLHTTVLGAGHLGAGGVWHGDLYLRGDGDPTFGDATFNRVWLHGLGADAGQLAARVAGAGVRRVTGSVIGDPSLFDTSPGGPASAFGPDIADFGGQLTALSYDHGGALAGLSPGAFAARQFTTQLRAAHVQATASPMTSKAPRRARKLASVTSPRMSTMVRLMNIPSDDLFAEMLTKQLGARFDKKGSIGAGSRVISGEVKSFGLHPAINDGSGLDRSDRSSPEEVAALLRLVANTDIGRTMYDSLPLVGVNGTTRRIAVGTPAQGRCVGKTGTLSDVTNLAGYCHSRGRRILAFALFIVGPSNTRGIQLLGRMAAAIQRY